MGTLLIRNAHSLLTMDEDQPVIEDGGLFIRDHIIEEVGRSDQLPSHADLVVDAGGKVVLPGLINTHHHMYQTLTRAVPGAQDAELFDWLIRLYPIWGEMVDEGVYVSAMIAMAELALSGCTTTTDHLYLFPNDCRLESTLRAAQEIGLRFNPTRGSMSLGKSKGGLPPDHVVEEEPAILRDSQRIIEKYHDPEPYSMVRVGLAPCSPFSVTGDLMRETAELARSYRGVYLHTHVAETQDEEAFCLEQFGSRPAEYMQQLGWVGEDVWWAHAIWLDDREVQLLAETDTGVAHCPSSNMRLGSGIARVREMMDHGVRVGLAVDGSASNDSNNLLLEARMALLLQRVKMGAAAFEVMDAFKLATRGSASVIGRDDIGTLAPGKAADVIAFRLDDLALSGGAVHDPIASLLLCTPGRVDFSFVHGTQVVADGELLRVDIRDFMSRHNNLAREMIQHHMA